MSLSRRKALLSSPLRLNHFWVEGITVQANPGWQDGTFGSPENLGLTGRTDILETNEGKFLVRLTVGTKRSNEPAPYELDVTTAGFFEVPDDVPEDERQIYIHLNGSAILYGIARALVATITGIGPWGTLTLPSVNFVESFSGPRKKHRKQPEHTK